MRKASLLLLAALAALSSLLPAATEYDLGNGNVLVVNDDGTYDYRPVSYNPALWTGAQYSFNRTESYKASNEDVTVLPPNREPYWARKNGVENLAMSLVFISSEEVFVSIYDDDVDVATAVPYSVSPDKRIHIAMFPDDEFRLAFSGDWSRIEMRQEGKSLVSVLTRVD